MFDYSIVLAINYGVSLLSLAHQDISWNSRERLKIVVYAALKTLKAWGFRRKIVIIKLCSSKRRRHCLRMSCSHLYTRTVYLVEAPSLWKSTSGCREVISQVGHSYPNIHTTRSRQNSLGNTRTSVVGLRNRPMPHTSVRVGWCQV